jgi:thiazole synthase ThiGH ThiG subunit
MDIVASKQNFLDNDFFEIAGKKFSSRLLVGTGKYKDFSETALAIDYNQHRIIFEIAPAMLNDERTNWIINTNKKI